MDDTAKPYELPAMVILSRWDHDHNVPKVYPSKRDGRGNHAVFVNLEELEAEMVTAAALCTVPCRFDVVHPAQAQAFMDARAREMVEMHREAVGDGLLLRVYGFTDAQLAEMGFPTTKGETL